MDWRKIPSIVLILLLLAGFGYLYYRKLNQLDRLRRRQLEYRERVEKLEARAERLTREIESLQTPEGLEKLGRDKLGLVGENEVIFIIDPTPVPSPHTGPR